MGGRAERVLVTSSSSETTPGDAGSGCRNFDAEESIELSLEVSVSDISVVLPVVIDESSMIESELGGTSVSFLVLAREAWGSAQLRRL